MGRSRSRSQSRPRRQRRTSGRSRDRSERRRRDNHRDSTKDNKQSNNNSNSSSTSRSRRNDRSRSRNVDDKSKPKLTNASQQSVSSATSECADTKAEPTKPPRKSRWGQEPKAPELDAQQQAALAKLAQEQALKTVQEQIRIAEQTAEAHLLASAAAHTSSIQPQVNNAPKQQPASHTTGSNNTKISHNKQQNGHQSKYQDAHAQMKNQVMHTKQNGDANEDEEDKDAEHADFGLSGALQEDTETGNLKNGVVLKFSEPEDAAQPDQRWRLYVFKDKKMIKTLFLHRSSAYLVGRDTRVADILTEHSSCSKQHAVIQFRYKCKPAPPGSTDAPPPVVRPYIIDLESTNGVSLNGTPVDHSRYVELLDRDVIKFGESTREYVIISPEVVKDQA